MRFLRTPMKEMFYAYEFSQKILRRPEVSKDERMFVNGTVFYLKCRIHGYARNDFSHEQ